MRERGGWGSRLRAGGKGPRRRRPALASQGAALRLDRPTFVLRDARQAARMRCALATKVNDISDLMPLSHNIYTGK